MQNIWLEPSKEIFDPTHLIGRNEEDRELDILLRSFSRGSNPQVIGERRSGKSSLLNCAVNLIENGHLGDRTIPVLVNFKLYPSVIGINSSYFLLCAAIINKVNEYDVWDSDGCLTLGSKKVEKKPTVDGYYNFLSNTNWRGESTIRYVIEALANSGYSICLLIDEYEFMYFNSLNGRVGSFHTIRNLVMSPLPNGQRFQCTISGARRWDFHAQDVGSDDFNFIDYTIYLSPLSESECEIIVEEAFEDGNRISSSELHKLKKIASNYSGGMPYVVKILCNQFSLTELISAPDLLLRLTPHFNSAINRLSLSEKQVLYGVQSIRLVEEELIKLGLVIRKSRIFGDVILPRGQLWIDFCASAEDLSQRPEGTPYSSDTQSTQVTSATELNRKQSVIFQLANEVNEFIFEINENLFGKGIELIFDTTLSFQYPMFFNKLSFLVEDGNTFKEFIAPLYTIVFESTQKEIIDPRTKNSRIQNMAKYPHEFNRFPKPKNAPDVFHRIDVLRHKWIGAHDTASRNFKVRRFTPEESQEHYIGHRKTPKRQDYFILQQGLLKDFTSVLRDLLTWAERQ